MKNQMFLWTSSNAGCFILQWACVTLHLWSSNALAFTVASYDHLPRTYIRSILIASCPCVCQRCACALSFDVLLVLAQYLHPCKVCNALQHKSSVFHLF